MKYSLAIILLFVSCFVFSQSAVKHKVDTTYRHTKDGIAISKETQADIKAIDEEMKKLEEVVKEYNRLAQLKRTIYTTLIKTRYSLESLVGDPIITADSIKMIIVFPRVK